MSHAHRQQYFFAFSTPYHGPSSNMCQTVTGLCGTHRTASVHVWHRGSTSLISLSLKPCPTLRHACKAIVPTPSEAAWSAITFICTWSACTVTFQKRLMLQHLVFYKRVAERAATARPGAPPSSCISIHHYIIMHRFR